LNHFREGATSAAAIRRLFTAPELQATAGSSAGAKHPSIRFDLQKEFASSIELHAAATWTDATPVVSLLHSS